MQNFLKGIPGPTPYPNGIGKTSYTSVGVFNATHSQKKTFKAFSDYKIAIESSCQLAIIPANVNSRQQNVLVTRLAQR